MNNLEFCNYIFENDHAVILIINPVDGKIIDANKKACLFYGYPQQEFRTLNIADINTKTKEQIAAEMEDAVSKKRNKFNFQHRLSNGDLKEVEVLSGPIHLNGQTALFSIIIDVTLQKLYEKELMKFKQAVNAAGEIIFMTTPDGIIKYINPMFTKTYGYEDHEVIDKATPRILKSGKHLLSEYQLIWDTLKNKEIYKGELINKTKSGELIYIETSANPILDDEEEIVGFLALHKNVTQKKIIISRLIENEERFRRIFEEGPLGMALISFDLKIKACNAKVAQILGYELNELLELTVNDITSPDDLTADFNEVRRIIKDEIKYYHINKRYYKKNKEIVWINITVTLIRDNLGNPQYYLAMIEDINEQKLAEEKLRASELRYRALATNIPNSAVLLFDEEIRFILVEGTELGKVNLSKELMEGKLVNEALPKDIADRLLPYLKSVFEKEEHEFEFEAFGYTYDVHTLPLHDGMNEITVGMLVAHNITERIKIEKQLKELIKNKDKFFSIIAHDLKSPFHSLLGFSEFLANDYETLTPEQIKSFAVNINKTAKGVFALLENLLQWSMYQTGRIEYAPTKFKLSPLFEELQNIYNVGAIKKNISLFFKSEDSLQIFADRNMIFTVLRNLLSNSLKFTNSGGAVGARAIANGSFIEITVYDTGIGMSEEDIDSLFKLDKSVASMGTDNETGTGLGLILCKEFIKKNGGSFEIKSELNIGTSFTFKLSNAG